MAFLLCLIKEVEQIEWTPIVSWFCTIKLQWVAIWGGSATEQKIQQQTTCCKVQDGKTAHFIHVLLKLFKMLPEKSVFDYDFLLALRKIKQGKVALAFVRNAYWREQNIEHRKQMVVESIKLHFKMC